MAYKPKPRWTKLQLIYLENHADKLPDEAIAEHLGKTLKSIRMKRLRLGLEKTGGRGVVSLKKEHSTPPQSEI
jgi:hypothetical protein